MTTLNKEALAHIRRLQFKTTKLVNELFGGAWASSFKGNGIEFDDLREYQTGDPLHSIDWNTTARMQKPFVKVFKEERQLKVMLLIDCSKSTYFGTIDPTKKEFIAELSSLLAFSAMKNNDKVGLMLFTTFVEKYIAPKVGIKHTLRLIRDILYFEPKGVKTDLNSALLELHRLQKRAGSLIFILSDFLYPVNPKIYAALAKKHEVVALSIHDPIEERLTPLGLLHMEDLETGSKGYFDTSDPQTLINYAKEAKALISSHKRALEKVGATFLQIQSGQTPADILNHYLTNRK